MRLPRVRFRLLTLMVVVALVAFLVNGLRPLTSADAARTADARFQKIPGAVYWAGRYRVHPWPADAKKRGPGWFVDFIAAEDGSNLTQMWISSKGKIYGVVINSMMFRR